MCIEPQTVPVNRNVGKSQRYLLELEACASKAVANLNWEQLLVKSSLFAMEACDGKLVAICYCIFGSLKWGKKVEDNASNV